MSQQTQIPELDNVGLLAAIPGSLFPQRTQNPLQVGQYFKDSPEQARWMDRFYL